MKKYKLIVSKQFTIFKYNFRFEIIKRTPNEETIIPIQDEHYTQCLACLGSGYIK